MPNLLTPLPFLDASGQPANGFIFAQATRTFSTADGFITTARSMGRVVNGVFLTADDSKSDPFVLVTATADAPLSIVIKLDSYTTDGRLVKDGGGVASRTVTVPDVGTVTWLDLVDVVAVADAVPYVIQPWMQDAMDNAAAASASAATATTKAGEAAASAASIVRGGANGVAPLDAGSRVPDANLPTRLGASELSTTIDGKVAPVAARTNLQFPPAPITPNPAQIASVTVSSNSENLTHTSTSGTKIQFGLVAEPGRYDYFGAGGSMFTYSWNGNNVIRAGTTKDDIGYGQFVSRFSTNSSWLMLRLQNSSTGTFDGSLQIRINGQPIWQKNKIFTGTYAGVFGGIDIQFKDNSYKTVEIFSIGWPFSVHYETAFTLTAWKPLAQKKLYVLGDSYTVGTSQALPNGSYARYLQTLAPWDVSYNGQGGTGYVANGSGDAWSCKFGDSRRLAAITAAQPDMLVILGSINDNGKTGIQAAATALYSAVLAASPATKIIVIGPQLDDSTNPATSTALAAAAAAASNVIGYVEPTAAGWDVPGVRGPTDPVHPSALGAEWYAHRVIDTVRTFTVAAGDNSW